MKELGFLLSATVRSNIYLQLLINRGIFPKEIIIYSDGSSEKMGQAPIEKLKEISFYFENKKKEINLSISIFEFLDAKNIDFKHFKTSDINSQEIEKHLSESTLNFFIYSGYGGVIVKNNIINSGVKLIHAHSGRVPDYRGSTTLYYSILNENKCYVSVFFLDNDIDTGPLLKIKEYPIPENGFIIDYIYDALIRADALFELLSEYKKNNNFKQIPHSTELNDETYFIIHPVLKHMAILKCNQ